MTLFNKIIIKLFKKTFEKVYRLGMADTFNFIINDNIVWVIGNMITLWNWRISTDKLSVLCNRCYFWILGYSMSSNS